MREIKKLEALSLYFLNKLAKSRFVQKEEQELLYGIKDAVILDAFFDAKCQLLGWHEMPDGRVAVLVSYGGFSHHSFSLVKFVDFDRLDYLGEMDGVSPRLTSESFTGFFVKKIFKIGLASYLDENEKIVINTILNRINEYFDPAPAPQATEQVEEIEPLYFELDDYLEPVANRCSFLEREKNDKYTDF